MSNILTIENRAIEELETIFANAGWSDGWALTDEQVRSATEPLYYRNATSAVASEAKVKREDQIRKLYAIYSLMDTDDKSADDRPFIHEPSIAIHFYYDDAFIWHKNSPFNDFLHALIEELEADGWSVSLDGEQGIASADNAQPYITRKTLVVSKLYL